MSERDPLRRQILERLGNELDPQTFEDAVCDLLRNDFPTLVPIRGGSDAGMDGAIADGEGEAYPLVATTSEDVIGNFTESLDSYVRHGGRRRKVVLATSRALTPRRQRNLKEQAREKGFTLIHSYERQILANLLYRDAHWRLELLGLSGAPEALSAVPMSRRPTFDLTPVGRDETLEWLRKTPGDRILAGLPGSGKTFLLENLIREGWPGLFRTSDDETRIANALRAQEPGFHVIVDDAHLDPDALVRLRRLRLEIGKPFHLVATVWEGKLDAVREVLPEAPVHSLKPLSRSHILEIYHQVGIREEEWGRDALRELITQAANQPGLAVSLAVLCLRGAWAEVASGNALGRNLLEAVRALIGDEALEPRLAALALGGDAGMPLEAVAEALRVDRSQLWRQYHHLRAAGLLMPRGENGLAICLPAVRAALLGKVFFSSQFPAPAPWRPLFDQARDSSRALLSLLEARLRGVPVPDEDLRQLVEENGRRNTWWQMSDEEGRRLNVISDSATSPWRRLALTSEENARWALDHYPGDFLHLADELLWTVPGAILPRLFERLAEEEGMVSRWHEPFLKPLTSWLHGPLGNSDESLRRRQLLAAEARRYLRRGGSPIAAVRALAPALSPGLSGSSTDPAQGTSITLEWSRLPDRLAGDLETLVVGILQELRAFPVEAWPDFERAIESWLDLRHLVPGQPVQKESATLWREAAIRLIRQVASRRGASPGLAAQLAWWGRRLGLADMPAADPDFEAVYPSPHEREPEQSAAQGLTDLASSLSQGSPADIAARLLAYHEEARKVGRTGWAPRTRELGKLLADQVGDPVEWLTELTSHLLPWHLISPFYERALELRCTGWEAALDRGLNDVRWNSCVAGLAAAHGDLPAALTEQVLKILLEHPKEIFELAAGRRLALPLLCRLLTADPGTGPLAAAVGEWFAPPEGEVQGEIRRAWRQALLEAPAGSEDREVQFLLQGLLAKERALAREWLLARLERGELPLDYGEQQTWLTVLRELDAEARQSALARLRPGEGLENIISAILDDHLELYEELLKRHDLESYHLLPLGRRPDPSWIPWASAALTAGHSPEDLGHVMADAAWLGGWTGSGLEHWLNWEEAFAALEGDPREEIRAVGRSSRQRIAPHLERARRLEEHFALHGYYGEE